MAHKILANVVAHEGNRATRPSLKLEKEAGAPHIGLLGGELPRETRQHEDIFSYEPLEMRRREPEPTSSMRCVTLMRVIVAYKTDPSPPISTDIHIPNQYTTNNHNHNYTSFHKTNSHAK